MEKFLIDGFEVTSEPLPADFNVHDKAAMQQLLDDCPDCQAAIARGEAPPRSVTFDELRAAMSSRPPRRQRRRR